MTALSIGDAAPDFSLPTDNGGTLSLSNLKGKMAVIYFYPKDDTPGCTKEAIAFTELVTEFDAVGVQIIGVSKDTAAKHDKFKAKHDIGITLVSDEDGTMVNDYGVWVEKNMYGKTYMGIQRATFLIDANGIVIQSWPKVRVKDHAESVLEAARQAAAA